MSRDISKDSPDPLNKEKFLAKIRSKAEQALLQMGISQHLRVLVINFDSPSDSVSEDYIRDAEDMIREIFNGDVQPDILFYRYLV